VLGGRALGGRARPPTRSEPRAGRPRRSGRGVRFVGALEHGKPTVRLDKVVAVLDALGRELRAELKRP
jgi:hypothetical protein